MVGMYNLFSVVTSIISVFVSLITLVQIIREKPSKGQMYFVLSICSTFTFCLCSFIEVTCTSLSGVLNAVKVGYTAKLLVIIFFVYFFAEYNHIKLALWMRTLLWSIIIFLVVTIVGFPYIKLFYRQVDFYYLVRMVRFNKVYGPCFYLMLAMTYSILFYCMIYVAVKIKKTKDPMQKKKNTMLVLGLLAPTIGIALQGLKIWKGYDLLSVCFTITGIFFMISVKKFHMFDIEQNAKDMILDHADEAVVIVNSRREIIYFNSSFQKIFQEAELYRPLRLYQIDGLDEQYIKELCKVLFSETGFQDNPEMFEHDIEFTYHGMPLSMRVTPILRKNRTISGYLAEIRDLTEEKKDLAKIEELTQEAEKANKSKSAFLANMSHEIRTPINAILGMDEMIIREAKEKTALEYANSINIAGNTLLSLVNDILDYSKLESGKMDLVEVAYDTKELIEKIYQKLEARNEDKNIEVKLSLDPNLPKKMYGDEIRVEQMIINIFAGGLKYCKHQILEAEINVSPNDEMFQNYPGIILELHFKEKGKVIRFQDIDYEAVSKNFSGEKEKIQNSQMELSVAILDHLTKILGGTKKMITKEDNVELIFTIPQGCVDNTPMGEVDLLKHLNAPDADDAYINPDAKVLVVDDNAVNLKVMQGLLKRTQVQVSAARSGKECLQKVKEESFDIIFMDHLMPGMDGIETLEQMRQMQDNASKEASVIALTANALAGAKEMYMEAGFTDYLMKPVNGKSIEKILKLYIK